MEVRIFKNLVSWVIFVLAGFIFVVCSVILWLFEFLEWPWLKIVIWVIFSIKITSKFTVRILFCHPKSTKHLYCPIGIKLQQKKNPLIHINPPTNKSLIITLHVNYFFPNLEVYSIIINYSQQQTMLKRYSFKNFKCCKIRQSEVQK